MLKEGRTSSTKKCAYCGITGVKLTREHTLSNFLAQEMKKRKKEDIVIFAQKSKPKLDDQNVTTRDVCAECNNVHLGMLDNYGRKLYEQYFSKIVQTNEKVIFKYDYPTLSRWILKTAYNAARKEKSDEECYSQFAKYCIRQAPRPANFLLFLFLLRPYVTNATEQSELAKNGLEPISIIEPWGFGIKKSKFLTLKTGQRIDNAKIFQINSYNFLLVPLSTDFNLRLKQKKELTEFLKEDFKDIWLLTAGKPSVKVKPSFLTYVDTKILSGYTKDERFKVWLAEYLKNKKLEAANKSG